MAGRDQGRISLAGRAFDRRRVQLGSARMSLPAQKLKAVGGAAAASSLTLATHRGNDRPHGGKGMNTGWGEIHAMKYISRWKKLYKRQQARAWLKATPGYFQE